MVTAIQPGTANQICRHDAVSGSDGDWIQVTGGAAEGWVAADKVASMFSPQRAEEIIAPAAKQVLQLTGRTHCDRIVVFEGNRRQIGQLLDVAIYDSNPFTLFGSVVTQHVGPEVYSLT